MTETTQESENIEIEILEMGGTINGILDPDGPIPDESRVVEFLEKFQSEFLIRCSSKIVVMKDSRVIQTEDRKALTDAIRRTFTKRILVPHGTFTMPETGRFLQKSLGEKIGEKCVVLVGAMIPLGEEDSDAPANLEFAVANLREAPLGVWIAMNRKLWNPQEVQKDQETGEFRIRDGV